MGNATTVVRIDTTQRQCEIHNLWDRVFLRELHYCDAALEESDIVRKANGQGATFVAIDPDSSVVGAISLDWWRGMDVSHQDIAHFQLSRFVRRFSSDSVVTVRKWFVTPPYRNTGVAYDLLRAMFRFTATHDSIKFVVIDSTPSLVGKYRKLGLRQYAPPFAYESGELSHPMCLFLRDHRYLAERRATLLPYLIDCGYTDNVDAHDYWHWVTTQQPPIALPSRDT